MSKPPIVPVKLQCSTCGSKIVDGRWSCSCRAASLAMAFVPLLTMILAGVVAGLLVRRAIGGG